MEDTSRHDAPDPSSATSPSRVWVGHLGLMASLALLAGLAGCAPPLDSDWSYYEERIAPILSPNCARNVVGCHLPDAFGNAAGNLDLSSYDSLLRRRDVLAPFGPYPVGMLLAKASEPNQIDVETFEPLDPMRPDERTVTITTDIRHAGGRIIALGSRSFNELRRWIDSGFARTGVPIDRAQTETGECSSGIGFNNFEVNRFETGAAIGDMASFERFRDEVQPLLRARCAGEFCHGDRLRGYYIACGDTDEEIRWNYFISVWFLADPPEESELLRRPLDVNRGGSPHVGGDLFSDEDAAGYRTIRDWAVDLLTRNPDAVRELDFYATRGFRYFVNRVQPMLVRKGCMFQNCHSAIAQNQDLQLLAGSDGRFSRASQHRNHGTARGFLSLSSADPNQSRIIAKNLFPPENVSGGVGVAHRGGALFEAFTTPSGAVDPASPDDCLAYDADNDDLDEIPAYCILVRWHEIEREEAIAQGKVQPDLMTSVLWVARPLGVGETTDFDTYRPGADLLMATPSVGADGSISLGPATSLLAGCGLTQATADVRRPRVSWDATRIAFAARSAADEPLRLYWMDSDGAACGLIPGVAPPVSQENGILTHDFDPAFSPNGEIVFASTRGNLDRAAYTYEGPTRTPASMEPNANLYVYAQFDETPVRQLTHLLNQELQPGFTVNGRVMYTIEKRQPQFHQMALRRMNLDGGDFRPFFGARPSVGFASITDPIQLPNLNVGFVAGPLHATDGAGSIGFLNLSLGVAQPDRDPGDRAYLRALRTPAVGGVFRSPATIPTGRVLVSCDLGATDPMAGPFDFDLCELDPSSGSVRVVLASPGVALVDPVVVYMRYVRPSRAVIESDGETLDRPLLRFDRTHSEVIFHDFPLQVSLEFSNIRALHPLDDRIRGFDALEPLPPPTSATTFADVADRVVEDAFGQMYVANRVLGHVSLNPDGSAAVMFPGGTPLLYRPTDVSGAPLDFLPGDDFEGSMMPREADQYYPGEQGRRGIPRRLFNNLCGFCHAGLSGSELPVATSPDVLSGASQSLAVGGGMLDLNIDPASRSGPE